jgi:hypothetical protein
LTIIPLYTHRKSSQGVKRILFTSFLWTGIFISACERKEFPLPEPTQVSVYRFSSSASAFRSSLHLFLYKDRPFITFTDPQTGTINLAYFTGTSWETKILERRPKDSPSLLKGTMTEDGTFFLLYGDKDTKNLRLITGNFSNLNRFQLTEPVPPGEDRLGGHDLTVTKEKKVLIVYRNRSLGGVDLLNPSETGYIRLRVDSRSLSGYSPCLFLDEKNRLGIFYGSEDEQGILFAEFYETTVTFSPSLIVKSLPYGATALSCAYYPEGKGDLTLFFPRIAFYDPFQRILLYGEKITEGGGFSPAIVDRTPFRGGELTLKVTPKGVPVIVYQDGRDLVLFVAYRKEKEWVTYRYPSRGSSFHPSLGITERGKIYLAYVEVERGVLQYGEVPLPY